MGLLTDALGFLGFMTWRYYLFFYIGSWVRRHFDVFLSWTNNPIILLLVACGFMLVAIMPHTDMAIWAYLTFAVGGILGLTMVFTLFRMAAPVLTKSHLVGNFLQFLGTRTLDIYLLHYFFLPRFFLPYGEQIRNWHCKPLEFVAVLALALVVVLICLAVSYMIRLSPFLSRWLFGVRKPSDASSNP